MFCLEHKEYTTPLKTHWLTHVTVPFEMLSFRYRQTSININRNEIKSLAQFHAIRGFPFSDINHHTTFSPIGKTNQAHSHIEPDHTEGLSSHLSVLL